MLVIINKQAAKLRGGPSANGRIFVTMTITKQAGRSTGQVLYVIEQ